LSLSKQFEELKSERRALESDRERLETFASEIERRSREIDELCKVGREGWGRRGQGGGGGEV
jgi:chromosome segregation ATPase